FLAGCPESERVRLLTELVHADMTFRQRAGEDARADDYLRRFPELAAHATVAAELKALDDLARLEDALRGTRDPAPAATPPTPPPPPPPRAPPAPAPTAGRAVADSGVPRPPLPRRYDLKRLLGEGGMGDVWLGRDRRLRRFIAVKVVQQRWAHNVNIRRRF